MKILKCDLCRNEVPFLIDVKFEYPLMDVVSVCSDCNEEIEVSVARSMLFELLQRAATTTDRR